jgi:hypothetical protein
MAQYHRRRDRLSKQLKGMRLEKFMSRPKALRDAEVGVRFGSALDPSQRQRQGQASHFEAIELKRIHRNIAVTAWDLGHSTN